MKKILMIIAAVLLLVVLLCPGETAHRERLQEVFRSAARQAMQEEMGAEIKLWGAEKSLQMVDNAIDELMDSGFSVSNYLVFSVGRLSMGPFNAKLSMGLLGMVFSVDEVEVKQMLRGQMSRLTLPKELQGVKGEKLDSLKALVDSVMAGDDEPYDYDKPMDIPPIPGEVGPKGDEPRPRMRPDIDEEKETPEAPPSMDDQSDFWD